MYKQLSEKSGKINIINIMYFSFVEVFLTKRKKKDIFQRFKLLLPINNINYINLELNFMTEPFILSQKCFSFKSKIN